MARVSLDADAICFIVACVLSAFGSLWMLIRCQKACTLFARLMWHLALTDLLYATIPNMWTLAYSLDLLPGMRSYDYCKAFLILLHGFEIASATFELCIAIVVIAAVFHSPSALLSLDRPLTLVSTWVFCFLLTLIDFLTTTTAVNDNLSVVDRCGNLSPVFAVWLCICLACGVLIYVAGAVKARRLTGDAATKRAISRAVWYPLLFFVTYGALTVYNFAQFSSIASAAFVLANLNGFANAITYGILDVHSNGFALRLSSPRALFPVGFRTEPSVLSSHIVSVTSSSSDDV